jgi:dCMP deaminase
MRNAEQEKGKMGTHIGQGQSKGHNSANWDRRFMNLAIHIGGWSKDRSTKVGCVIVGPDNEVRSLGFNGFPRDVDDDVDDRHARPQKYLWTEHAERNAIYNAARVGVPVLGCRMYLPWYPCADCARAIVQAGIEELIAVEPDWEDSQWGTHFKFSQILFTEVGIKVRIVAK